VTNFDLQARWPKARPRPDGTTGAWTAPRRHVNNAMVKAIARAFRWREMLETGTHATIAEIAAAEKINESYVGRVLRLTLRGPDIIEAILGGGRSCSWTSCCGDFPWVGWNRCDSLKSSSFQTA
jgi:hypothetical protein